MIALENLTVRFGGLVALDAVSARFGEPVSGIVGPNGAGKTTTMNVISGFLTSQGGRVRVGDTDLLDLPPYRRTRWGLRRSFQRDEIAGDLTVEENLRAMLDNLPLSRADKREELARALDFTGLGAERHRLGATLNSYDRRLTDVARCVIGRPKMILFDEPAGGLTGEETEHLGALILAIPGQTGAQVLVIDHDVDLISRICSQTLVLDFGRRIAFGPTAAVFDDPAVKAAYLGLEAEDAGA